MREYERAVGDLLGAAAALEMDFESECEEDQARYIRLRHRGHVSTVIAEQNRPNFTLVSDQRVSNIDEWDIQDGLTRGDVDVNLTRPHPLPNIGGHWFVETVDETEYIDGVRQTTPLFVYDEDFNAKELDRTVSTLCDQTREIFEETLSPLNFTVDKMKSADEGDSSPSDVSLCDGPE